MFNRVSQLGGQVDDYMGNGGQWGNTGRRLGYNVSQTPKAGSMISFAPGTAGSDPRYGHVAFVEAVGPSGILVSEGNVYGGTTISYRVISNELAHSSSVSYIMPRNERRLEFGIVLRCLYLPLLVKSRCFLDNCL